MANAKYRSGPFLIDTSSGEISRDGIPLKLRPQAFQLLQILVERPGEVVTREELVAKIWGSDTFVDFDQGLNFCVREARKVLGDGADQPKYLQTLPRRGYRFIAAVEMVGEAVPSRGRQTLAEMPAAASPAPAPVADPGSIPARAGRSGAKTLGWMAVTAAVCLAIALGAWLYRGRPSKMNQPVRLVVLPFENLTGDASQDYLVRGVVEEITAQLGAIEPVSLAVVGRTSAEAVASHGLRIDQIANQLNVDYVVEGSVRREGNQLRITAQLIRSSDMAHVWAESYDRDAMRLFTVEEQVAANIVREVNLALGRSVSTENRGGEYVKPEAMDAYLRGRDHLNSFINTVGGVQYDAGYADAYADAEREFRRAIELDPRFGLPYAGLADLAASRIRGDFQPDPDWNAAEQLATQSLQLDPTSVEARLVLARVDLLGRGQASEAERLLSEILTRNPNEVRALGLLIQCHLLHGKTGLALSEAQRANQVDPMNTSTRNWLAEAYYRSRQYKKALEILKDLYKKQPDALALQMMLMHTYYMDGNRAGWMETYLDRLALKTRLEPSAEHEAESVKAHKIYEEGGTAAFLAYLKGEGREGFVTDGDRNPAYRLIMLEEPEKAMDPLERAASDERNLRGLRRVVNDPMLEVLRSDPRFEKVMQRLASDR